MKIKFYSFIDKQKTSIETDLIKENDWYKFYDKDNEGFIYYKIENSTLRFKRCGLANMNLLFDLNNDTVAHYENKLGLSFDMLIKTKRLSISKEKIIIDYDYYLDGTFQSNVKLYLIVENALAKM